MEDSVLPERIEEGLESLQRSGKIAAFEAYEVGGRKKLRIVTIGDEEGQEWIGELETALRGDIDLEHLRQKHTYYLLSGKLRPGPVLSQELRPGSGLLRAVGGVGDGPGGTLTCFLNSRDGLATYLVAAGHVLSNFWEFQVPPDPKGGSIYHLGKGFPSTSSTRFIGKLFKLTPEPEFRRSAPGNTYATLDVGIVRITGEFELKARTTCYGTFGEWPPGRPQLVQKHQKVMKCGAQEAHWTFAEVEETNWSGFVYGRKKLYELRGQVLLRQSEDPYRRPRHDPYCGPQLTTSFAVPGDSGTMVVDRNSKRPVGMLVAGSVLNGTYVMTPFPSLWDYWTGYGLIMIRA